MTTASRLGGGRRHGVAHLQGRGHAHHLAPGRVVQGDVRGHQGDLRAAGGGRPGQRVPLPPRRPVAEEADRVQFLPGAARRHHDPPAGQVGASPPAPRASTRSATANISAGSGSRPGPVSGAGEPADGGIEHHRAPLRSSDTLAWVAGCCHISVCMAGANTTGQRAVSRTAVSRSSDMPAAARASRSAVAGATMTRSALWPSLTWGTSCTSSQTADVTGSPDSAAQVASPTKRRASRSARPGRGARTR